MAATKKEKVAKATTATLTLGGESHEVVVAKKVGSVQEADIETSPEVKNTPPWHALSLELEERLCREMRLAVVPYVSHGSGERERIKYSNFDIASLTTLSQKLERQLSEEEVVGPFVWADNDGPAKVQMGRNIGYKCACPECPNRSRYPLFQPYASVLIDYEAFNEEVFCGPKLWRPSSGDKLTVADRAFLCRYRSPRLTDEVMELGAYLIYNQKLIGPFCGLQSYVDWENPEGFRIYPNDSENAGCLREVRKRIGKRTFDARDPSWKAGKRPMLASSFSYAQGMRFLNADMARPDGRKVKKTEEDRAVEREDLGRKVDGYLDSIL